MKRLFVFLSLIIILGMFIGAFLFLRNRPPEKSVTNSLPEKVEVYKVAKHRIIKVEMEREEDTLILERSEDVWKVNYPYTIVLSKSSVDDILSDFAAVYAEQVVEERPGDLDRYGLESPAATARVTLDDGSTRAYYLGDQSPAGTYYFMIEGDERIFEVWMRYGIHFHYTVEDLREKKLFNIDPEKISYIRILRMNRPAIELSQGRPGGKEMLYVFGPWKMTRPYLQIRGVDVPALETFLKQIMPGKIDSFVDEDPEDLALYGLNPPQAELLVKSEEDTFALLVGKEHEANKLYAKMPDAKAVMLIESKELETMDIEAFELTDKFVFIINIDRVEKIKIEGKTMKHSVLLQKKSLGEGESTVFIVNGRQVGEKPFKLFYQALIGIMISAETEKQVSANAELRVVFTVTGSAIAQDEPQLVILEYIPYNRDFYAVSRDGVSSFVVARTQVQEMLDSLDVLIREEL